MECVADGQLLLLTMSVRQTPSTADVQLSVCLSVLVEYADALTCLKVYLSASARHLQHADGQLRCVGRRGWGSLGLRTHDRSAAATDGGHLHHPHDGVSLLARQFEQQWARLHACH
jgi:hypothetical protein